MRFCGSAGKEKGEKNLDSSFRSLVGFGSKIISLPFFLKSNEGFGGLGKNGIDRCWEFPVKFAERTAFAHQHTTSFFLVGNTGAKTSAQ